MTLVTLCAYFGVACGGVSRRHTDDEQRASGGSQAPEGGGAGAAGRGGSSGASGGVGASGSGGAGAGSAGSPGCPESEVATCNPGPAKWCTEDECTDGSPWFGAEVLERGRGIICKFEPDSFGPDFACLVGEWCDATLRVCRCGDHAGCERGERCAPACVGGCEGDPNDYACSREVACTRENLDECAAAPGTICRAGALDCSTAAPCDFSVAAEGSFACGSGCCPPGHWCFDDVECRCGADPVCGENETCVLGSIGFHECRLR